MMLPLDGPAKQIKKTVTDSTVLEIRVDAEAQEERKVITVQPLTGKLYVYFGDDTQSAPNATTVQENGFLHFKWGLRSYEAAKKQPVYFLAVSGSVDVIIAERA